MWGYAEIDQFDARFFRQQDIMTFHVAMHTMITVQKDQSFDSLLQDISYLVIR